jgi:hypothetical protein
MNNRRTLRQVVVALVLLVAFLCQGTWALAGTTGGLSGQVTGDKGAPVAGAAVKVTSASQTAVVTTDAGGRFNFLSLAPDTYTVTATKDGYAPSSYPGVVVFADQGLNLQISLQRTLKQIANVTSRSAGSLVKSGTTASVYSVNAAQATQTAGSGGGYNLDSAYSAIYSQPGISSYIGNYGFGQVFYIRGSSYSQTGYEYDGIPVNRAFDNYSANSLSNLGASETEVYTGGSPASASSNTLGGYINQVIKTGTYPGSINLTASLGTPSFYHKIDAEAGGATPDRLFSYYVALRGADSIVPTIDSQNGSDINPNGNNPYGLQGDSFNVPLYMYDEFIGTGGSRGPWSSCNGLGQAPAGTSTLGLFASHQLASATPIAACNNYQNLAATNVANYGQQLSDRENIMNFHFGIPHKKDSGRDDVQLMFDNYAYLSQSWANIGANDGAAGLNNWFAPYAGGPGKGLFNQVSAGTFGGSNNYGYTNYGNGQYNALCQYLGLWGELGVGNDCAASGGSPLGWADGSQVHGVTFGQNAATATGVVKPYFFPSSPSGRPEFDGMASGQVDGVWNNGSIVKAQYQKNFGSSAFVRVLGYTFYSDWLQNDPNGAANYTGIPAIGFDAAAIDYELDTHTRGVQIQAVDQINSQNLVTLTGNYVTANVTRYNNSQPFFTSNTTPFAFLENASGQCFSYVSNTPNAQGLTPDPSYSKTLKAGSQVSCLSGLAGQTLAAVNAGALPGIPGAAAAAGAQWTVAANINQDANINTVSPRFLTTSLEDEFRPNDRLDLNLGVRLESYGYALASTNNPEANFWYNQINATACVLPQGLIQEGNGANSILNGPADPSFGRSGFLSYLTTVPGGACPSIQQGQTYHPGQHGVPLVAGADQASITKVTSSPRFGGTYTFNPNTVVRFSYGRYVQPTETAFEQVLTYADGYQQATNVYGSKYFNNGFNTTVHDNPLQYSNNADLSIEKRLNGTDMSFKLTPFYRYTSDQLVTVSLPGGLAGGFNAATQRTSGVEFQFQKGDPTHNGLSGQFSYTYTNAKLRYSLINGVNSISGILQNLQNFWALTKNNKGQVAGLGAAHACYAPDSLKGLACSKPNAIINPYYNLIPNTSLAQLQSAYDVNGWYPTYANYFPSALGGVGNDIATAISPSVFNGYLTWKHNKFTAGLNGVLNEGSAYGSPVDIVGIDPTTCIGNQTAYGANPGSKLPDYQTCSGGVAIPNPTTGQFDGVGQYRNPWQFNLGMQFSYEFTNRISGTVILANVVNTCFGGSAQAWTAPYKPGNYVCGYATNGSYLDYTAGASNNIAGAGYYYGASPQAAVNGTAGYPNEFNQPYAPVIGALPFQAYFALNLKL